MTAAVFDMGGTLLKCALMNEQYEILCRMEYPTPYGDSAKESLTEIMLDFIRQSGAPVQGIAVSMPGMIDSEAGFCLTAGALTYLQQTPFGSELASLSGLPCTVENDGKCAAMAEFRTGALKDCVNGAVVILGTAVGGGLILNGSLYKGRHFSAGEFSYALLNRDKMLSYEGFLGSVCGTSGLLRLAAEKTGEPADRLTGRIVFDRAEAGEAAVLDALRTYTDILAVQLYNLNAVLDLDVIAVGGGISRRPLLHAALQDSLKAFMQSNPMSWQGSYIPTPTLVPCRHSGDSNLLGALGVFLSQYA